MELFEACNSIIDKVYEQGSKMTEDEALVLKKNLDNSKGMCYYALGLLMNSSCRIHHVFGFKGYDEMQKEAFNLLEQAMDDELPDAYFWMGEIKSGLFGKFPMDIDNAKEMYEKYYNLKFGAIPENSILIEWDEFVKEKNERFKDLCFIEKYKSINPHNVDTSGHDDAYYESLSKDNDDED